MKTNTVVRQPYKKKMKQREGFSERFSGTGIHEKGPSNVNISIYKFSFSEFFVLNLSIWRKKNAKGGQKCKTEKETVPFSPMKFFCIELKHQYLTTGYLKKCFTFNFVEL